MRIHALLTAIAAASIVSCTAGQGDERRADTPAPDTEASVAAPTFASDSAYAYIERQLAFGTREPGSAGHEACGRWLADELKRHGADTVMTQRATVTRSDGTPLAITNIMGRFNPRATTRVLLAAHWDTRPWADAESSPELHHTPIPGANDGASGVAVLLETARLLGQQRPDIGVDLLMLDAEDSGISGADERDGESSWCLGSQYWSRHTPYADADRPRFAIVLDMVGGTGATFHREAFSQHTAGALVDKVWATARRLGHGNIFSDEPGGAVIDDHLFIANAGIPAIDIIESRHPATGTFAPTWHTMADDITGISRATLRAVGETVAAVIYNEKP